MRSLDRLCRTLPAAIALLVLPAGARAADRQPHVPDLKVEKYTLPNGLDVVMLEDHGTPVVGVNIWYKVGSKNEKPGRTGFAHLFEHLMFQGSQHHDKEYFGPIEKLGAQINGSTNTDRTNYFETLPSNGLELALWLEADRMGFLLPALTQQKLDNQRDVVKNERRQRVDNVPYGQSMEKMLDAMYPADHPYHHSVIGSMADLSAASRDDVSAFFRTYYTPSNASLAIVGDFQPDQARKLVDKYFGPIPAGPKVARLAPRAAKLDGPKHITLSDDVRRARVQLEWPTVERGDPDEQPLHVLAAVLGQLPRQNRLYRALEVEKQQAVLSRAMNRASELAGSFAVSITAAPGRTLDELVQIADREIERLKKEGPTEDEVVKAQNADESGQIFSLESATRLADFLNGNNVEFGDPRAYITRMKKLFAVTPEDVKRVANTYLTASRIRLDVNPGHPTPRAPETPVDRESQPGSESVPIVQIKDTFDRSKMPEVTGNPPFTPPPVVRRKLSNGLDILIAERHKLPIVTMRLEFRGGDNLAPKGKEGLADMTASLLTEGTESRDSLKLAGELSEIGATMNCASALEETSLSISTLTRHEAKALDLFVDVLTHPSFPALDMERLRRQRLAALSSRRDSPTRIASLVFPKLLYGVDHPYGRIDTVASVKDITRDDVVAQYKKIFMPNNAALIVVGDAKPDVIADKLEKALHDWKPGDRPEIKYPEPPAPPKQMTVYLVNRPAAAQSVLTVGQVGVPRMTPDYFALLVLNGALGGQFSSRINLNLREDKGYTYGARSSFAFRHGPGPFQAGGSVQTAVTKEALAELVKEIKEITGSRPLTDDELGFARDRLIKGFPSRFETTMGQAGALSELVQFHLPDDYFTTYQAKIQGVTQDDVARAAQEYLHPDHMTILVVGDRPVIEPKLKELPYASTIHLLDPEGNPASRTEAARPAAALFIED